MPGPLHMLQRDMRASRKLRHNDLRSLLLDAILEELDVVATTELRIAAVMVRATSRRSENQYGQHPDSKLMFALRRTTFFEAEPLHSTSPTLISCRYVRKIVIAFWSETRPRRRLLGKSFSKQPADQETCAWVTMRQLRCPAEFSGQLHR